ncbi:hypothetical protein BASA82_001279 [Batrachochytrium salamandrivorans]|nr:hypothetical protein BASA82_001279 [Batrachochytrium salamandrivorans]
MLALFARFQSSPSKPEQAAAVTKLTKIRPSAEPESAKIQTVVAEPVKLSSEEILTSLKEASKLSTELPATRYTLGRLLSKGGFGEVYTCRHRSTNQEFVVKTSLAEEIGMVQREVAFLRIFQHPNIIAIEEAYMYPNKSSWIVVESMDGGDLYHLARFGGGWRAPIATYVAQQVLQALDYLHENSVVHRDIKLENVLWDSSGAIKLCDFGLATVLTKERPLGLRNCGTVGYRAPEIILARPYDTKVDIWSLGVMLMTLIQGQDQNWDLHKHAQGLARNYPVFEVPCDLDPELKYYVLRMLKRHPQNRASARELLRDEYLVDTACDSLTFHLFTTKIRCWNVKREMEQKGFV